MWQSRQHDRRTVLRLLGGAVPAVMLSAHRIGAQAPPTRLQPLVVCVAPNGARRTAADHPAVPTTPAALAQVALECADAGAHAVHVHARDAMGRHTLDPGVCRETLAAVREHVGERLVLQLTTEAVGIYRPEQQMALVRALHPPAVSLAISELAPTSGDEPAFGRFLDWVYGEGIGVQHILYSDADLMRLVGLVQRRLVPIERPHVLLVLGRYGGADGSPRDLTQRLERFPRDWPWSVCTFGPEEGRTAAAAIALGGHTRIGFENNFVRNDGRIAAGNAELIADVCALARASGCPLATLEQARALYLRSAIA